MTLPPPRRPPARRSPRVRHDDAHDRWAKVESFSRTAMRAGAGDDVGSLTSPAKKKRFVLDGRALRLVAIFLTVMGLSAAIAAFSSRSVEVSAIEPEPSPTQQSTVPTGVEPSPAGISGESESAAPEHVEPRQILVHVSGEVTEPGVVTLDHPARVVDAVEEAGGPTAEADLGLINLAQTIEDGSHIHVPASGEGHAVAGVTGSAGVAGAGAENPAGVGASPGVNINTATQTELETIPGVGPVTAQAIISWREENGDFTSVDQLIEVNGIGPKTLDQLRDHVRVS